MHQLALIESKTKDWRVHQFCLVRSILLPQTDFVCIRVRSIDRARRTTDERTSAEKEMDGKGIDDELRNESKMCPSLSRANYKERRGNDAGCVSLPRSSFESGDHRWRQRRSRRRRCRLRPSDQSHSLTTETVSKKTTTTRKTTTAAADGRTATPLARSRQTIAAPVVPPPVRPSDRSSLSFSLLKPNGRTTVVVSRCW